MRHNQGKIIDSNNTSLYYQSWEPDGQSKAVLLLVHGLAEHTGRYTELARYFVSGGFAIFALDHPGHGKSDGIPGHINRFSDYTEALLAFLNHVRSVNHDAPIFLVGHSMGGLISAVFLLEHQSAFVGCVISGAAIKAPQQPSRLSLMINRVIATILPKLGVLQLDASAVSRDDEVVSAYMTDPMVFRGKITARLAAELFKAMSGLSSRASAIKLPILILHGGADTLTSPEGSKLLHQSISSEDKTLIVYDHLYHEIFNEPERKQVMAEMKQWLDTCLAVSGPYEQSTHAPGRVDTVS